MHRWRHRALERPHPDLRRADRVRPGRSGPPRRRGRLAGPRAVDNLDIASNLLLGNESGGLMRSEARFHGAAAALLTSLGIGLLDTTRSVGTLSGGERQLLAVARAMSGRPRLLILDEPTGALGVNESAQFEQLTANVRAQGTTVLLVSHDIEQMFRLADRITVLRHGRVVADVDPEFSQPEDVVALISGSRPTLGSAAAQQASRPRPTARLDRPVVEPAPDPFQLSAAPLGTDTAVHSSRRWRLPARRRRPRVVARPDASAWANCRSEPPADRSGWRRRARARLWTTTSASARRGRGGANLRPMPGLAAHGRCRSSARCGLTGVITVFREVARAPAASRARPRHAVPGLRGQRGRARTAARRGHRAQPHAGDHSGDARDACRPVPLAEGLIVVLHSLCTATAGRDGRRR